MHRFSADTCTMLAFCRKGLVLYYGSRVISVAQDMLLLFLFFLKHCQTVFSYADSYHCVPFVQPISAGYVGQRGPRTSPFTTLVFAPAASSSSIRNGMQESKMFIYKLHCFLFSLAFHGRMCSLQVLQTCLSFWFLVTCKCTWLCSPQKLLGVNFQLKFAKS